MCSISILFAWFQVIWFNNPNNHIFLFLHSTSQIILCFTVSMCCIILFFSNIHISPSCCAVVSHVGGWHSCYPPWYPYATNVQLKVPVLFLSNLVVFPPKTLSTTHCTQSCSPKIQFSPTQIRPTCPWPLIKSEIITNILSFSIYNVNNVLLDHDYDFNMMFFFFLSLGLRFGFFWMNCHIILSVILK